MIEAVSISRDRIKTLILWVVCGLAATVAVLVGIDDNLPGVLLALLAAMAFILAFAHPWQTARKFVLLLLASVLGFVFFVVLNILSDSIAEQPAAAGALQDLIQSPVSDALNLMFALICAAAFIVGAIGSAAKLARSRRKTT